MTAAPPAYEFNAALLRRPAKSVVDGLRAENRGAPNYDTLTAEHDAYVDALRAAGVEVTILPALEAFPDSVFVEDPALVFPEGAILLRPGAASRLGEAAEIAPTLRAHFKTVLELPAPGFVEGGDVLTTTDKVMVGLSRRTNRVGAESLKKLLAEFGRGCMIAETPADVLHFKTDCSLLADETVLTTKRLAQSGVFNGFEQVIVPDGEEPAANALRINDIVLVGSRFPKTIELLDQRGYAVIPLPTAEIGKIDAGLSCMSLRWRRAAS